MIKSNIGRIIQFATYSIAFISTLAITKALIHFMGVGDYAKYVVMSSIALFVRISWHNLIIPALSRFYPQGDSPNKGPYIKVLIYSTISPILISLSSAAALSLSSARFNIGDLTLSSNAIGASLLLGAALGTNAVNTEIDNVSFKRLRASLSLAAPGTITLLSAIYAGHLSLPITGMIYFSALVIIALELVHLYWIIRRAPLGTAPTGSEEQTSPGELAKQMAQFAAPMAAWTAPALLLRVADKWVATALLDVRTIALYGVLLTLSQNAFTAIYSVLNRTYVPEIYKSAASESQEHQQRAHRIVDRISYFLLGSGIMGFFIALFFGREVVSFVSDSNFPNPGPPLSVMIMASCLYTFGDCLLLHGHIKKDLSPYAAGKIISPILYILASIPLAKIMGLWGMAISYMAAAATYAAMAVAAGRHQQRKST